MKFADVKFLAQGLMIEVYNGPEGILESMCCGGDVGFSVRVMLNDTENDTHYCLGDHSGADLHCLIKQFLGALTADNHIVVFTAEVAELTEHVLNESGIGNTVDYPYPVLPVGSLITVIYDEMRDFGCVCRVMVADGEEVDFIQSKPFIDYDIDAAPLMGTRVSLPDELQEVLDRLHELEEAEATGDTAGEPGDSGSGNPSDGKSGATTVTPAEPEDNFTMEPKDKSGS